MVSRGDIWLVLPESTASAQPCVILSPPEIHDYLGLVTVAPITPGGRAAAYRVPVDGTEPHGLIRLEQIRTVETRALTRQVGTLDRKTLGSALATLREMFAD